MKSESIYVIIKYDSIYHQYLRKDLLNNHTVAEELGHVL